jgi:hypothetical protein
LADSRPIEVSSSVKTKVVPFKGPAMAASLGVILGRVLFNIFAFELASIRCRRDSLRRQLMMYCSACGGIVTTGLTYCKHCGAKLNEAKGESPARSNDLSPGLLVSAIVSTFVLGIISITALMIFMKKIGINEGLMNGVLLMTFLLMFFLEGTFIWLLMGRRRVRKDVGETERPREQTTKELDAQQARALPEPIPSVTEHTTRTLEPTFTDRKSN